MQGQREDLTPLPVRGEPRGGEWPRRRVHLQQGEAGEQPPFPVPGEVKSLSLLGSVAHAGEEQAAEGRTCWMAFPRF